MGLAIRTLLWCLSTKIPKGRRQTFMGVDSRLWCVTIALLLTWCVPTSGVYAADAGFSRGLVAWACHHKVHETEE